MPAVSEEVKDLIRGILVLEPTDRLSMEKIRVTPPKCAPVTTRELVADRVDCGSSW